MCCKVAAIVQAMKTAKLLNYAGYAALAYVLFQNLGNWLSQKISVGSIRLKMGSTVPTGQNVTLYIPVKNSAPVSYPLDSFQGVLYWGENPLAQVNITQAVTITASNTTEIPVSVFIPFANLGTQVVNVISSGDWLAGAKVKGMLRAAGINVPIQQTIQLL